MQITFTPKQTEFAEAVFSGEYQYLCYGGSIQSGKTTVSLVLVLMFCRMWPGSRWAIVRKDLPTLRRNTLPSFNSIAPRPFAGPINHSTWEVDCANGSKIIFFPESIKDDPDLNRWKGLLVSGFLLEEVNELQEASLSKAIERAGSWQIPNIVHADQPPPLILMTCNPAQGHVKRNIYMPWKTGLLPKPWYFCQAFPTDNPHLTPQYRASLENLKKHDPVAYERFVLGNWEISDDPTQLIKYEWVNNAKNVEAIDGKRGLGVDVARFGDDDTVFCPTVGNQVLPLERHHGLSLDRTAELVAMKIHEGPIDAGRVCVDAVGLGAGVVDILQRDGFRVTSIISGAKANNDESDKPIEQRSSLFTFKNLRSQLWWNLREELRQGKLCIEHPEPKLLEDLTAVRYSISADKMVTVESKDDLKKRIGRSPDAGDALVYARANTTELRWTEGDAVQRVPLHAPNKPMVVDFNRWDTDADDLPPRRTAGGLW